MDYVVAYGAFYDLERGAAWLRERVGRLGREIEVVYDGDCGLCVRTVTILDSLDWFGRLRFVDATRVPGAPLDAMYAFTGGKRERGFHAFRAVGWVLPPLWPAAAAASVPGASYVGTRVYERVARNRSRMGSCGVPSEAERAACD
jgi:predicted DCC family thiol-disulfide oxidoreductase YuxK